MPESRIDDLNPEQLRAATMGEEPVLIIAGAGTGKTKTLALSSIPTAIAYLF
jgi:DNA helicase-2/ATP-dependent DNA helicase PcrA